MVHVFLLQVHHRPEQLEWLADLLLSQGAGIVVHIDAKNRDAFRASEKRLASLPGVAIVQHPVVVNWSGFSQVRATLLGIEHARSNGPNYDYVHLLSGECFPLRRLSEIDAELAGVKPLPDFIECVPRPEQDARLLRYNIFGENPHNREWRYTKIWRAVRDAQSRLPYRSTFRPDEIRYGSQWWSLSRATIDDIFDTDMRAYIRKFRWTRCADEYFFQIRFNSLGKQSAGNRRFIRFPPSAASPDVLSLDDLRIARDRGDWFARKVPLDVAREYARLEGW